jgi:replicative DNA helicase
MTIEAVPPLLPPQDLEAEQSVLGAILLDPAILPTVSASLTYRDFYKPAHGTIYMAMEELAEQNEPIDLLTLTDQLRQNGQLENAGGSSYLAELLAGVSSTANVKHHCRLVREKALRRQLGHAGLEIHRQAYDEQEPLAELLSNTEERVFKLAQGQVTTTFEPITKLLKDSVVDLDRLYKRQTSVTGVPSGFLSIDARTAGWQPGDLIIIGARPSMGKTSLALGTALHAAIKEHLVVGIFSLEMSKRQLVLRMLSAEASIDAHMLRTGQLTPADWWKLTEATGRLEGRRSTSTTAERSPSPSFAGKSAG